MSQALLSVPIARILIIDDAPLIHEDFRKILLPPSTAEPVANEAGIFPGTGGARTRVVFEVESAFQGQDALAAVHQALAIGRPFAVAFVDMRMPPGWDGIETVRRLWQVDPHLQVVICTAHSDYSWEETVRHLGDSDSWVILKKPFDKIEVLQLAHALANKWAVTRRDRERMADLDRVVRERTDALAHSESRFVKAFHANPVPVTLQTAADGRYVDVNDAFLRLTGHERPAVVTRSPAELGLWPDSEVWELALRSVVAGTPLRAHRAQLRTGAGARRDVLVSVEIIHVDAQTCLLTSLEDITDRLLLEQQLQHLQKMEAVGQLAAGVAHDFNNLLTVIQSYTGLALADSAVPTEHRAGLSQIQFAAERASALTRQLLVFSRRQITQPKEIDTVASLAGLREILQRLLPAAVSFDWQCPETLPRIRADEANLAQVLMNLIVNARDALPGRGGRISFEAREVVLDRSVTARHVEARAGRYLRLAVRDNGSGIEPAVLPRIFEPFFTTKPVGAGTGLGLSTVYAIVRQHEGWIEVQSVRAQGTHFEIFLPALEGVASHAEPERPAPSPAPGQARTGERILLVEDDAIVRRTARLIATRGGYAVTDAADATLALAAWAAAKEPFDLLLTDMVMPNGCNGAELAAQLRLKQPGLKVILSTGYSPNLLGEQATKLADVRLLLKPYTATALLEMIRAALDAPASEDGNEAKAI